MGDLTTLANLKQWLGLKGKPITAITRANPGVVTCNAHGFVTNDAVGFSGILGMTQLNGQVATITVIDANTFSIGIDTSAYGAYVSGGFLGIDDSMLAGLVTAFSTAVQSMLNRDFVSTVYTDVVNGNGRAAMMVPNYPITAVSSVTIDGTPTPARTSPTGAGFTFDEDTIYLSGYTFSRGMQNVQRVYTAGFATPPADLVEATTESCAFLFRERSRIGLSSQVLDGQTTAYLKDLPPHLMRRFTQYARVVPLGS